LKSLDDEESLTRDIIKLAVRFGRYGYRRVTALLRDQGWQVNHKRGAHLAIRRAESTEEAAEERTALAQRWFNHQAEART
jgi:hypothetical protein